MKLSLKWLLDPRLQIYFFILLAASLQVIIWFISPVQGPVVLYKVGLAMLAAIAGFFCDLCLFPYASPDSYLKQDWREDPDADNPNNADFPIANGYKPAFTYAALRRAVIVAAFVLGVSLGL